MNQTRRRNYLGNFQKLILLADHLPMVSDLDAPRPIRRQGSIPVKIAEARRKEADGFTMEPAAVNATFTGDELARILRKSNLWNCACRLLQIQAD